MAKALEGTRVVTWHDGRGVYPVLAGRLAESARGLGIPVDVHRWPECGDVREAQKLRVKSIRRAVREHPGDGLLVLDADCRILARPDLVAGFPAPAFVWYADTWFSGVWYLPAALAEGFAELMEKTWERKPSLVEREVLNEVLRSAWSRPEAVLRLPVTYGWVEPMHRKANPAASPVIEHYCVNMGGSLTLRRMGLL